MALHHARLRLVSSQTHLDLCNSWSRSAASPRGSAVRLSSISLTEEGASPTSCPISESVIPLLRNSVTRDAHVVMCSSLREPVDYSQRPPVTVLRDNVWMPRPKEMPADLDSIGRRVRWWREYRKISRPKLAKLCGMGNASTLSDLELDRTGKGGFLHLIAVHLKLNSQYLQTGKGEPEADVAQEPPPDDLAWPFDPSLRPRLSKLTRIEHKYLEMKLQEVLEEIETERRKTKKSG